MRIAITGSRYQSRGQEGDFGWMIDQQRYSNTLFIFNDNEEQFVAFHTDRDGISPPGGGNAIIRPYQCIERPRSAGVPTGSHGRGYQALTPHVREVIDLAIAHIRKLLDTGNYSQVIFSVDETGTLGTGIFKVAPEVKDYIVTQLQSL